MTKRERYIGIGTLAALVVLALNYLFVAPLFAQRETLDIGTSEATAKVKEGEAAIARRARDAALWRQFTPALKRDASDTESQIRDKVLDWAQAAGLSLTSTKLDRPEKEKDFYRMTVHATGSGTMEQLGYFLYHIQTAQIPVRVSDLQIGTRKEATDDLSITLGISTIYLASDTPAGGATPGGVTPKPAAAATPTSREATR